MTRQRMHPHEVLTDSALLRQLLELQFPEWAGLPIEPVESYGTDNDVYRLGLGLSARLPRVDWAARVVTKEAEWLPRLAPHLPQQVPTVVAVGRGTDFYPFHWSIHEWLSGTDGSEAQFDPERAATDLAHFIVALREINIAGAPKRPRGARGSPLTELDEPVRRAIRELGERIDGRAAMKCWQESIEAPAWNRAAQWVHGDLLPGNLIFVDGRLSAVIDFAALNVGDPACDLQPAWNVFTGRSRSRFRAEVEADDDSWMRGRGWALFQALVALPYYWNTNPRMVRQASYALGELLGI